VAGVTIRRARREDVEAIVRLLADDRLGASRETVLDPLPEAYLRGFDAIDRDDRSLLVVAEDHEAVVGTMHLNFLQYLTHEAGERAQVEAVRVASSHRGTGLGRAMMTWAVERARDRGCVMVQLTTDKRRPDALRFYEAVGFVASHEGLKLALR
jgi:GNAT superfamily N-acetyltransferase